MSIIIIFLDLYYRHVNYSVNVQLFIYLFIWHKFVRWNNTPVSAKFLSRNNYLFWILYRNTCTVRLWRARRIALNGIEKDFTTLTWFEAEHAFCMIFDWFDWFEAAPKRTLIIARANLHCLLHNTNGKNVNKK